MRSFGPLIRRTAPAARGLIVAFVLFGVVLMHSAPLAVGEHPSMPTAADSVHPVAFGEHDCSTPHQMMHQCAGSITTWTALTFSTTAVDNVPRTVAARSRTGTARSEWGRAPPWTLWTLDQSVLLRV
ncbi:hypothetical protein DK926_04630 [Rhodococcus sp. Eu-32]|uniref:DUF6153 family protein n=1 Tax=Rhodococcus sp. Eu-32 TaxID=1017319 RepID=UPI000DF47D54|nr:DUF6153 family protein [Rhodococcus sp. Eu-32]RRQ29172.1 hypothetical protein DK926_04630 [Rhodococcus sp. Eu-32]